jgi:hypothetical protein
MIRLMSTTVIYRDRLSEVSTAAVKDGDLWLSLDELRDSTGWELKPEGACIDDRCVPIPADRRQTFVDESDSRFNLTALARQLRQPVLHNERHDVWLFGEAADARHEALLSLQAPGFALPDLGGRIHSLSDFLGKKVFLASWASW